VRLRLGVDGTVSETCPRAGLDISGVESSRLFDNVAAHIQFVCYPLGMV
jgi:hypothetical protein